METTEEPMEKRRGVNGIAPGTVAKALGITIPKSVLLRADRMIE